MFLILALALGGSALLGLAVIFNRLVGLRNRASGAWSDIDVQLKRRHDLVENLVAAVRAYADHERNTLESVTRVRAEAEDARAAGGPRRAGEAESRLGGALGRLLVLAESYPDLKADRRFADLQKTLVSIEDDLQNARRYYNAVVRDLNTRIQSFPDLLAARPLGFREREFFHLEDRAEAAAPRIDLEETP